MRDAIADDDDMVNDALNSTRSTSLARSGVPCPRDRSGRGGRAASGSPRARAFAALYALVAGAALTTASGDAHADPSDADIVNPPLSTVATPPPLNTPYLQYGVSFSAEFVASAGPMCDQPPLHPLRNCILGSGGGIAARLGRRSAGPWYFGGAYEVTKQDPNSLYRLAVLQQLRGEARYYVGTGKDTQPYGAFGGGVVGYGNEWAVDTFGGMIFLAVGLEAQLSRRTVVGVALAYRAMYFTPFSDPVDASDRRLGGVAQFIGIDISLEGRDPIGGAIGRN